MPFCAAISCSNRQRKGCNKSFHRFPSDPTLCDRWLMNIKRECWKPNKFSHLCSDHFEEKHIDRTGQITRLRSNAIPTLFTFPTHLKKTAKQYKLSHTNKSDSLKPKNQDDAINPAIDNCITDKLVCDSSSCQPSHPKNSSLQQKSQDDSINPAIESFAEELVCNTSSNNPITFPAPNILAESVQIITKTPTKKYNSSDHAYYINDSPKVLKQKLDLMNDKTATLQKRLKTSQTNVRRLKKRILCFQEVFQALKLNDMLSERGIEMLEKTGEMPGKIFMKLIKLEDTGGSASKERHPPEVSMDWLPDCEKFPKS